MLDQRSPWMTDQRTPERDADDRGVDGTNPA